jgi:hypothetical protein
MHDFDVVVEVVRVSEDLLAVRHRFDGCVGRRFRRNVLRRCAGRRLLWLRGWTDRLHLLAFGHVDERGPHRADKRVVRIAVEEI